MKRLRITALPWILIMYGRTPNKGQLLAEFGIWRIFINVCWCGLIHERSRLIVFRLDAEHFQEAGYATTCLAAMVLGLGIKFGVHNKAWFQTDSA